MIGEEKFEQLVDRFEKNVVLLEHLLKPTETVVSTSQKSDAVSALTALGFKKTEVVSIVDKIIFEMNPKTVEEIIREGLKRLR